MNRPAIAVGWILIAAGLARGAGDPAADDRFETKIRPILAEHCWKCHGPEKQSADLRLDSREAILKGGSGEGPSIIIGNAKASPLVKAVRHDGDVKMPPKSKLPESAAADLAEWINAGAVWPSKGPAVAASKGQTHWSFQPVKKTTPAGWKPGDGLSAAIDAFIAADLAKHSLTPAPRADRRTLIRRATFDLIGLPPTAEEVDAFVSDSRPDREAFADLVDHLLASPHYGERWGRHWLDVARYADTKGYVFTQDKNYPYSYTYRDWVVEAFNEDMPYDQFVIRQIAADRLPPQADNRHLAAMGFLTVGRRFLMDENEIIDDRIDVVTRGLLGLSVACARCHDHKFDPIPTEDYYSLYGVFLSSEEPAELPLLHVNGGAKDAAEYKKKHDDRVKAVETFLATRRGELERELQTRFAAYLTGAEDLDFDARSPRFDAVARDGGLRPELLRRVIMRWKQLGNGNDPYMRPWKAAASATKADFRAKTAAALAAFKANAKDPKANAPAKLLEALAAAPIASRRDLARAYGGFVSAAYAKTADRSFDDARRWLLTPESPTAISAADLRRLLTKVDRNKLATLEKEVNKLDASHPGAPARAMVMVDKAKPYDPHIFIRGNPGRGGPKIPRQFLKVLSPPNRPAWTQGSGRLELAKAIVAPENPLTSRVMVNRIWADHFGQGIVRTPSDYGLRGDPPTHPALLDWLAATFVEQGWSIKSMHRNIMLSETYQRSSEASAESLRVDPLNLRLSHQNRRRLDFEATRDSLLAVSGKLDATIGGKHVPIDAEPSSGRRTLYAYVDRYNLDPIFRIFDFPNPDASSPRRANTTVPQQALFLLNSPFVIEQAKHLAARADIGSGSAEHRIQRLYHVLFGRDPDARELAIGLRFATRSEASDIPLDPSPWLAATGEVVGAGAKARVANFRALPHWTGQAWQLAATLPTADGNYASIHAGGGHPGPNQEWSPTLRWVAPADMTVALTGSLEHAEKKGDGVRARIVSSRSGLLGAWEAHGDKKATDVAKVDVRRGETLDFVVDCRAEPSFDGYRWSPAIKALGVAPKGVRAAWDARTDFRGPAAKPIRPWEAYAQALLLTNEFFYID